MTDTIIRYTYRRADSDLVHGPVYLDRADDGRSPWIQASERCAEFGDVLVSAERVARPALYKAQARF